MVQPQSSRDKTFRSLKARALKVRVVRKGYVKAEEFKTRALEARQNKARKAGIKGPKVMDETWVKGAYKKWAPVYDHTFGKVAAEARRHAVEVINRSTGRVLEVGVGTGLSLPDYKRTLEIVGIDLSPEMLDKARERVAEDRLHNVKGLHEMDAGELTFADNSFDTVAAMYVITVVPDPAKVMKELARVCKPGGEVMLVNHFSTEEGVRGWVERRMAPFGDKLGWRPVFDEAQVMICPELELFEKRELKPMGIFTMMRFRKLR